MDPKRCYLMRGLPSCGKSFTARRLAGETGVVCETDEFFHTQVGGDPAKFNYRHDLLAQARAWNFARFAAAIDAGNSPVIVDRGNSLSPESRDYARYAFDRGYQVELREPESAWWQEIRVLLKHKQHTMPVLEQWSQKLAQMSRSTHRVPASTILSWMEKWKWDVTIQDILNFQPPAGSIAEAGPTLLAAAG